jgi:hypothetical protein
VRPGLSQLLGNLVNAGGHLTALAQVFGVRVYVGSLGESGVVLACPLADDGDQDARVLHECQGRVPESCREIWRRPIGLDSRKTNRFGWLTRQRITGWRNGADTHRGRSWCLADAEPHALGAPEAASTAARLTVSLHRNARPRRCGRHRVSDRGLLNPDISWCFPLP